MKKKIVLLLLVMLLLSGCQKRVHIALTLQGERDYIKKINTTYANFRTRDYEELRYANKDRSNLAELSGLFSSTTYICLVLSDQARQKYDLDFNDGLFFVDNNNNFSEMDSYYINKHRGSGRYLSLSSLASYANAGTTCCLGGGFKELENAYQFERVGNFANLKGIVLITMTPEEASIINRNEDNNGYDVYYIPGRVEKHQKEWVFVPEKEKITRKYLQRLGSGDNYTTKKDIYNYILKPQ